MTKKIYSEPLEPRNFCHLEQPINTQQCDIALTKSLERYNGPT